MFSTGEGGNLDICLSGCHQKGAFGELGVEQER